MEMQGPKLFLGCGQVLIHVLEVWILRTVKDRLPLCTSSV